MLESELHPLGVLRCSFWCVRAPLFVSAVTALHVGEGEGGLGWSEMSCGHFEGLFFWWVWEGSGASAEAEPSVALVRGRAYPKAWPPLWANRAVAGGLSQFEIGRTPFRFAYVRAIPTSLIVTALWTYIWDQTICHGGSIEIRRFGIGHREGALQLTIVNTNPTFLSLWMGFLFPRRELDLWQQQLYLP